MLTAIAALVVLASLSCWTGRQLKRSRQDLEALADARKDNP